LGIFFRDPFVGDSGGPLVMLVGLCRALRLSEFLIKFACVLIAVVEVDGSAVEGDWLADVDIVGC
jgi:hypothetical protein